jgi:hypothetical protein
MRFTTVAFAIALAGCTAGAQEPEHGSIDTLIQEAKAAYSMQKDFILAAADNMPEANYSFKPTPEIRSYGELFTHIVQVQNGACAIIAGQAPSRPTTPPPTTKTEIIAQLKASFDACDAANATVIAANALDVVGKGFLHGTRVGLIEKNAAHDNEMYGTIAVYLRLKGIVPPSTAARGRM